MQPLPLPPSKGKGKAKDKGKGREKAKDKGKGKERLDWENSPFGFGGAARVQPSPSLLEVAPWASGEDLPGRRPSTITLSGDDTFTGQLKSIDADYHLRRQEWSVRKVRSAAPAHLNPVPGVRPKTYDIWACPQIGQLKVDRTADTDSSADTAKPPQQRLNVSHIPDPNASGNKYGGPASIIHKHSKAVAFSIFRSYGLLDHRPGGAQRSQAGQGGHGTLPTSNSFLLATKRVQQHYTSTKTTKLLSTHGLLEEEKQEGSQTSQGGEASQSSKRTERQLVPSRPSVAHEGARRILDASQIAEIEQETSADSQAASSRSVTSSLDLSRPSGSFMSHATSTIVSQSTSTYRPSSAGSSVGATPRTSHDASEDPSQSDSDSDESARQVRTSHAEAFATLDPVSLEQYRARYPTAPDSPQSVTGWFRRRMKGPSTTSRSPQANISPINPPWITLAPRLKQEEQDRVIQVLSSSFKDVGLLPSFRKKGGAGIGRTGQSKNGDVLTHIPDDSLYMLLPLWPRETDPASAMNHPADHLLPPQADQRLYLLVYYMPFEDRDQPRGGLVGDNTAGKKRSRSNPRKIESGAPQRSVVLKAFRVIARLVAHADFSGSGVRLPSRGLSVTGPMEEAMRGIPSAALRDVHQDDYVIGVCLNRDAGVEFVPEGLDKLGLCEPRMEVAGGPLSHPAMQTREISEEEVEPQPLTAIGRAAVEMAWLGCMAVTTFHGY
ncbi:hypothetical protein BV25DRAFT_1890732 [Artomyces pyxidatus]|uniref:Uncharacterized protein n=1 Tax=Artomyces pyxidatus TaxID=48021 RepID=A0ACB8SSK4_9AGAM|nr:hypothetical protein BV25DRAFT_1890732 [Artomyces pyxidatus]